MKWLNSLRNKFRVSSNIRGTSEKFELSKYLKSATEVALNYNYEIIGTVASTKYSLKLNQVINKDKINEDIRKLREMCPTGLCTVSYTFEDVRPLLDADNRDLAYDENNKYLVYEARNNLKRYDNGSGIRGSLSDFDIPAKIVGYNHLGISKSFIVGRNMQDIREIDEVEETTLLIGEFFGIIYENDVPYFIYGIRSV